MADNTVCMKRVEELLNMKFFIPDYQRGYRWTYQQAKDLLDDIEEFCQKNNDGIYCLQPLVVRETIDDRAMLVADGLKALIRKDKDSHAIRETISKHTRWEVIDGQQRLTTMFILLKYLNVNGPYEIVYETREDSKTFLAELNFDGEPDCSNVDYYHMSLVANTIKKWFDSKQKDSNFKEEFKKTILERVKFIWYEAVDEDPIKVFTRLNIGKIKLTNAELIKALFLNRSNFNKDDQHLRLRQQEIASEWDTIEYTLQNDEFWLFLNPKSYDRPTRIDFIFDLIYDIDSSKLKKKLNNADLGTDEYKTFRYFYAYFHDKSGNSKEESQIDTCWKEVKKYFQIFQEWFNDYKLYHYVGYLVAMKEDNTRELIKELICKWNGIENNRNKKDNVIIKRKGDFLKYIEGKIKTEICDVTDLRKQYAWDDDSDEKKRDKDKDSNPPKTKCKPVLLLHNILTIIKLNEELSKKDKYNNLPISYKFPFHLYKLEKWDVEHIDSNTTNDLSQAKYQREWLEDVLEEGWVSDSLKNKIQGFLSKNNQDKEIEEAFPALWQEINDEIDDEESERLSQAEKNQIWNFCLLDAGTNRSYGNAIFSVKRKRIIAEEQKGTYILPVTKNIFLKYYSASNANFRVWSKTDADAYRKNISETLAEFGVINTTDSKDESNGNK